MTLLTHAKIGAAGVILVGLLARLPAIDGADSSPPQIRAARTGPDVPVAVVDISEDDAGKYLPATVGQTVRIALPGDPATSQLWSVSALDGDALQQVGVMEYVPGSNARAGAEAGGVSIATFRAVKAGESRVVMGYARPWKTGTVRAFAVTVEVTAPR